MQPTTPFRLSIVLVLFGTTATWAQNESTRYLYGKGVHAYYRGDLSSAQERLNEAIAYGSDDPRAYYFRGLAKLRHGDQSGAEADFRTAATLEFTGSGSFDVGMALSRIQGTNRMQLENIRRDTQTAIANRSAPAEPATPGIAPEPYNEFDAAPQRADRQRPDTIVEPDDLDQLPPAQDLPADAADPLVGDSTTSPEDPFANNAAAASDATKDGVVSAVMRALFNAGGKSIPTPNAGLPLPGGPPMPGAAEQPLGADLPAADDPFNVEGEVSDADADVFGDAPPAADDPFATDPTATPPAETPPADDPFGDDPFATDPAGTPPTDTEADPFGDAPPPAADDPFADDPGTTPPAGTPPADDPFGEPADAGNDPFGDTPPPAADDPFADDPGTTPPAETPPADDPFGEPADAGNDPFGEPAVPSDDPFGA